MMRDAQVDDVSVVMSTSLATGAATYRGGVTYAVARATAADWIAKGLAVASDQPPTYAQQLLSRLDEGAGEPCLFLPFLGEFGHLVMTHVRLVHFHRAGHKVVCCRPGEQVLFPTASEFVTDWVDPVRDADRGGSMLSVAEDWPAITAQYPNHRPLTAGGIDRDQEMWAIYPESRIEFNPVRRGLSADVVFTVRRREFDPKKNWPYWQRLADAAIRAGHTFAVVGHRETSIDLVGQACHSGDYDTGAAIELMQNAKLVVCTDTGGAHLASTIGARMLIFRESSPGNRNFIPRMERVNPGRIETVEGGWDDPDRVAERMLSTLGHAKPKARRANRRADVNASTGRK